MSDLIGCVRVSLVSHAVDGVAVPLEDAADGARARGHVDGVEEVNVAGVAWRVYTS